MCPGQHTTGARRMGLCLPLTSPVRTPLLAWDPLFDGKTIRSHEVSPRLPGSNGSRMLRVSIGGRGGGEEGREEGKKEGRRGGGEGREPRWR